jgi:hypothetical protein
MNVLKVADMETKLAETKASTAKDTATLEAKLAKMDLAPLREAYECNIQSLDGICSHVLGVVPSAEDYIRWLKSEVGCLPRVFVSVNENFISVVIEGVLAVVGGGSSVDSRRVAASCGTDVLPGAHDVKKIARAVTRD